MPERNSAEILIVEDSATQAEELRFVLEESGYRVTVARTGAKALETVRKRRPTLVVSDIVMPEMDGFTLCRKIKQETASSVPVILLTSLSDPEDVMKGLECGADNFITKPYDAGYLLAHIKDILVNLQLRSGSKRHKGMEIRFKGNTYVITAEREQILGLLLSTYETAMMKNDELKEAQGRLEGLNEQLEKMVEERTAALRAEVEERRRAEQTAQAERRRLYDVLETLPPMICLLTPDYHVAFANRAFREKFGDSNGRHCYEYCFGNAEPCTFCESLKPLETGKPHHWEVTTPDKQSVIDVYDLPFTDVDGSPLVLEMNIDITARKRAETELAEYRKHLEELVHERTTELEAFIYSVSHDLRAPLRSVAGFSKMLVEDNEHAFNGQIGDYLRRIHAGAERMSQIIEDLLRLSRLSRLGIEKTNLDMSQMARTIVARLRESDGDRRVDVKMEDGLKAFADANFIEIALTNLLGNAWKFTSKTPDARIEFGSAVYGGENGTGRDKGSILSSPLSRKILGTMAKGTTIFYIKDNGAGFNSEYAEKMFLPFQRLHAEKEFQGTGIGLTIVDRIIRKHGGRIWAEGTVGKGAIIYFSLG